jgi:hypothetical protein
MSSYRITLTLIAKGSINNLHRREVIEAFHQKGVEVQYLVREDYVHLLPKFPDCRYLTCRFVTETGRLRYWRDLFRYLRFLYPGWDICNRHWFHGLMKGKDKISKRLKNRLFFFLARFRSFMNLLKWIEGKYLYTGEIEGIDPSQVDQLLLLGLGTLGSELENILNYWARKQGISVVHMVGNYDHLTSKGYRGGPIDHLLVWGPAMRDDAIYYQGIEPEKIRMIGSIRYNAVSGEIRLSREEFFKSCGLDPGKRTILFAGPLGEYHYFEMLQIFEELLKKDDRYQMIFRIYPDKSLMASVYIKPIMTYAQSIPQVHVSLSDPHYQTGSKKMEVPQIEQDELWHSLQYSDVIVNHFSTMGLEACMFDKPVVYILYFPNTGYTWIQPPTYYDHGLAIHNRRMLGYGIMRTASNQEELIECIKDAVAHPEKFADERRRVVEKELGPLDGKAVSRLVEACWEIFQSQRGERKSDSIPEHQKGGRPLV